MKKKQKSAGPSLGAITWIACEVCSYKFKTRRPDSPEFKATMDRHMAKRHSKGSQS